MASRRPIVGGNWKMNTRKATAIALARGVVEAVGDDAKRCDVVVIPPFTYLDAVADVLRGTNIALGAQDIYPADDGAFTGEINAAMLKDLGVDTVVVGHSERRHVIGEPDAMIAAKLRSVLDPGLRADRGGAIALEGATLSGPISSALAGVDAGATDRLVIAYEPVWAIGTGRTATPEDAQAMHAAIRHALISQYDDSIADSIRIQYGGSMKSANAADLCSRPDVDGGLIGGASLQAEDFAAIVRAAADASVTLEKAEQS